MKDSDPEGWKTNPRSSTRASPTALEECLGCTGRGDPGRTQWTPEFRRQSWGLGESKAA